MRFSHSHCDLNSSNLAPPSFMNRPYSYGTCRSAGTRRRREEMMIARGKDDGETEDTNTHTHTHTHTQTENAAGARHACAHIVRGRAGTARGRRAAHRRENVCKCLLDQEQERERGRETRRRRALGFAAGAGASARAEAAQRERLQGSGSGS